MWRPKLDGLALEIIDQPSIAWLENPFEEVDVHHAVKRMDRDRAPGPYGLTMEFFQSCWEVWSRRSFSRLEI